jgi:hypothetical protein
MREDVCAEFLAARRAIGHERLGIITGVDRNRLGGDADHGGAFENIAGEGASMKGAAYAVILFLLSIVPILAYLQQQFKEDVR